MDFKAGDIVTPKVGVPPGWGASGLLQGRPYRVSATENGCEGSLLIRLWGDPLALPGEVPQYWFAARTFQHYAVPLHEDSTPRAKPPFGGDVNLAKEAVSAAPLDRQVGGSHYKGLVIQPATYAMANKLGPMETLTLKYISRWRDKAGLDDIRKAIHCLEMLIEFEEGQRRAD